MNDDLPYQLIQAAAERSKLDPYSSSSPRFVIVIDTDALLSSIDNHCRTGNRSRVLRIAGSNGSRAYASDHVYDEVYDGFTKIASKTVCAADLRACFEECYLPLIRWVDTDGTGVDDARLAQVTDQTDVPTAQLALLLAPCVVFSNDRSLRRPGFAPAAWRDAARYGADIVEGEEEQKNLLVAVWLPAALLGGGVVELGKKLGIPWWVSIPGLGVGAFALMRNPDRRRVASSWATRLAEALSEQLGAAADREQLGVDLLRPLLVDPVQKPTLKQRMATVLARQDQPQLASEIRDLLVRHFIDEDAPTLPQLRKLLKAEPEFTQPERYRWQLGRFAKPLPPTP